MFFFFLEKNQFLPRSYAIQGTNSGHLIQSKNLLDLHSVPSNTH